LRKYTTRAPRNAPQQELHRRQFEEDLEDQNKFLGEDLPEPTDENALMPSEEQVKRTKSGNFEEVGRNEVGQRILRPAGLDPSIPTKDSEEIRAVMRRGGKYKLRETVIVQRPLKDADLDRLVPRDAKREQPFDFSKMSSSANDVALLFDDLSDRLKLPITKNRDAAIQALESIVKNQDVKPMDPSTFSIGRELIELHVLHALSATYPNLPHQALIEYTKMASSREFLARALLSLKLEPFIQIVPSIALTKFPDPSGTCLQLGANAFTSLVGVVYLEHGFDKASELVFSAIDLPSVTPEELRRFNLLNGIDDAKVVLHSLLQKLYFPLPSYEVEKVSSALQPSGEQGHIYTSIVKSGHRIIGRGQANSKALAERRAASEAILNHWAQQSSL
jgi:dsRNA-specific ribonuclease